MDLRRYTRVASLLTVAAASLAVAFADRPVVPALIAAVLLILLPLLSVVRTTPDVEVSAHRREFYVSTAVLLWVMGGLAWWGATRLEQEPGWMFQPRPPAQVALEAGILVLLCLGLVWAFRLAGPRFGWRERPIVRDLMPVTPGEKRMYAVLSLAAGTGEEVAFRGFLPAFLMPWAGSYPAAVLVPTLAFGLLHAYQGAHGVARTTLMGLVLAGGVAWSGTLWSAMVAHAVLDLILGLALNDYFLDDGGNGS